MTRLLQASAILTLIALAFMVWSMLQPTPLPVMLAMSVGQGIGTLAFAMYGYVIFKDLRAWIRTRRGALPAVEPTPIAATPVAPTPEAPTSAPDTDGQLS